MEQKYQSEESAGKQLTYDRFEKEELGSTVFFQHDDQSVSRACLYKATEGGYFGLTLLRGESESGKVSSEDRRAGMIRARESTRKQQPAA